LRTVPPGQAFALGLALTGRSSQQPRSVFLKQSSSDEGASAVLTGVLAEAGADDGASFSAGREARSEAGGGGVSGDRTIGTYVTGGLLGGSAHAPIPTRSSGHAFIPSRIHACPIAQRVKRCHLAPRRCRTGDRRS